VFSRKAQVAFAYPDQRRIPTTGTHYCQDRRDSCRKWWILVRACRFGVEFTHMLDDRIPFCLCAADLIPDEGLQVRALHLQLHGDDLLHVAQVESRLHVFIRGCRSRWNARTLTFPVLGQKIVRDGAEQRLNAHQLKTTRTKIFLEPHQKQ
jgi:hypothetical protein